jgi:beta-glucosidase
MKKSTRSKAVLAVLGCFWWTLPIQEVQAQDYRNPALPIPQRVNDLMSKMTLDEKIGQMMQVDLSVAERKPDIITTYRLGSILSGGDSDPRAGNSAMSWRNATNAIQSYALKTPLRIPMIYGIDAVHGHSNVHGATIFPHNIGLGCTRDSSLIWEAARVTAEEMAATGIRWDFGPMVGVPRDIRWGRTYEAFGETPELAQLGAVQVIGLQGDSLNGPASVLACAKHYIGDGGTTGGINAGNVTGDDSAVRKIHLQGYLTALRCGVGSIMASYSSINGVRMHASKHWLTDVLKTELRFDGFIVSDWAAVDLLGKDYEDDVETSINAGIDMVMLPQRYDDFRATMHVLIKSGKIASFRVDDAVRRILTMKFALGLFEHPYPDSSLIQNVGSAEHRAIARKCVRESMVLLKNKNGVLPLPKTIGRILVAGSQADNLGFQCGGWTISWQGGTGNTTVGTTILAGMEKVAPSIQFDYSEGGEFLDYKAAYSVVVIGERPYAEGMGDRKDLSLSPNDVELIKKMKSYGNPLIVIIVSGRPLIIDKILDSSDAIVAAWLPGTEGDGVAEVLFGDYTPQGVLSFSWPKDMSQVAVHAGDPNYAPLFPYGYGITSYK